MGPCLIVVIVTVSSFGKTQNLNTALVAFRYVVPTGPWIVSNATPEGFTEARRQIVSVVICRMPKRLHRIILDFQIS